MIWFLLAVIAQAAVSILYLASGLVAPLYGQIFLWAIWIALTVVLVRFRKRGPVILLIPLVAVVLWWGIITLGELTLGWSG